MSASEQALRSHLLGRYCRTRPCRTRPAARRAVYPAQSHAGINPTANQPQHNRLRPYYLIYIGRDGNVGHDQTEVKRLLDLARTCCKGQGEPFLTTARAVQPGDGGRPQHAGLLRLLGQSHPHDGRSKGKKGHRQLVLRGQDHCTNPGHRWVGRLRADCLSCRAGSCMTRHARTALFACPGKAAFRARRPQGQVIRTRHHRRPSQRPVRRPG